MASIPPAAAVRRMFSAPSVRLVEFPCERLQAVAAIHEFHQRSFSFDVEKILVANSSCDLRQSQPACVKCTIESGT